MFFEVLTVPVLQNKVFNTREEALHADRGILDIQQNLHSGIFENRAFDSSKLVYDPTYDNEQAHSERFEQHLSEVCDILMPYVKGKAVVEVGCGKGHFFKKLSRCELRSVAGCDPAYQGNDERIIKAVFSPELDLRGDILLLRHVLEHIKDPVSFLSSLAKSNGNQGLIYIEVPDLRWIVDNQVYFDLFYEHVNYFVPDDFTRIFGKVEAQGSLFNGQYQYVVADLGSIRTTPYSVPDSDPGFRVSLSRLDRLVALLKGTTKPVFIWGAASKGVISALHLENRGIEIDGLIDINPKKQGRLVALTGLPVLSPAAFKEQYQDALVLIANANYENEIRAELQEMPVDFMLL